MSQSTFPSLKSENILVSHFIHSYALCTITRCLPLPPSVFHCINCYALPSAAFHCHPLRSIASVTMHCHPLCSIAFIAMACTAPRCLPLLPAVFHCIHCFGLHCHPLCSIAFRIGKFLPEGEKPSWQKYFLPWQDFSQCLILLSLSLL